jgi:multidrug resistance efflux pump
VQRLLSGAASLPQFVHDLVTTQAVVVAGTEAAGFIIERKEDGIGLRTIAHIRPDNSTAEMRQAAITAFQEIIKPCVTQAKDGAIEIHASENAPEPQFCLVTLLRSEGEIVAVSAVITRCRNSERAQQRLMSMQLVAGYFELFTLRRASEQSQVVAQSHQNVLQLSTAVATAEGFESAAMNLCNELATRTGAVRVALGWMKGQNVRVKAFSHTEQFDKKQELVKTLENVMEECLDQEELVHFDPKGGSSPNVSRAAQALSRAEGGNIVLSLPLRRRADVVGVVTLEFPGSLELTQQASTALSVAVDLLAPQLYDRYQNDRWLITKAAISAKHGIGKAVGPQHMTAKLIIVLLVAGGIFICRYKPTYHVTAPFQFDAINQRKLDAPYDGTIKSVNVQPGDRITKGEVLVEMDDSDLILNSNNSHAKADDYLAEYTKDKADSTKLADANIAMAEYKAALAEAAVYDAKIARSKILAPYNGIVLKGDLTDETNTPKKEGDELLVVSPDNQLRAKLSVSERDIQDIKAHDPKTGIAGQTGMLATTSLPSEKYPFRIDRIVPQGDSVDGENVFTVYATLEKTAPSWKPGVAGEARIDIQQKPLAWIWTHKLIDYVRLKLWI